MNTRKAREFHQVITWREANGIRKHYDDFRYLDALLAERVLGMRLWINVKTEILMTSDRKDPMAATLLPHYSTDLKALKELLTYPEMESIIKVLSVSAHKAKKSRRVEWYIATVERQGQLFFKAHCFKPTAIVLAVLAAFGVIVKIESEKVEEEQLA